MCLGVCLWNYCLGLVIVLGLVLGLSFGLGLCGQYGFLLPFYIFSYFIWAKYETRRKFKVHGILSIPHNT